MKTYLSLILILVMNYKCHENETLPKNIMTNTILAEDTIVKKIDPFVLHYDAIVVDTHNDILMPIFLQGAEINLDNPHTQSDFIKWKIGGLDVQVFSIYVPQRYKSGHFNYVMKLIDRMEEYNINYSNFFTVVKNYDELIKAINQGKFCGILGAEGGAMIEGSIEKLQILYDRGVRYLGLTWNTSNEIGISAQDESEKGIKGGLKPFGRKVVEKMNELGMLIDVSHLGETAFWECIELSKNPVIASHSSVYSLCPHYRNLTDEQIKAIASTGGYIGINFYNKFLDPSVSSNNVRSIHNKYKKDIKQIEAEYGSNLIDFNHRRYKYLTENKTSEGTSVDILINHIDYVVKLVGIDYVGLGSDFDGSIYTPNEIYDASCYPVITMKLYERGYSEEEIRKILGGNFLRVFKSISK
ncbi:MAG: dipeptidase [Ignavibacteria bacterium]|nr:dipeptidase [Ignavibacteria bacterium]